MKKFYFVILLLVFKSSVLSAQCTINPNDDICRGVFAGLLFDVLYQGDNVYNYLPAYYPSPYLDLQQNEPLNAKMKVLSYLQYDNGLSVFDYFDNPLPYFQLRDEISKIEAAIYVLEAYNIEPNYNGSNPFDDIDADDPIFGYAKKAYEEGFLDTNNGDFDPYDNFTVQETLDFFNEIINSNYHPINENLHSSSNYFEPGIYTPSNIGKSRGINQGVFSHYAKDSFKIPDVKFSLDFSHFYSTSMVELPKGFFKLKPLGTGWSHNYNAYITKENNIDINNDPTDFYFIFWPDGTVHIFNEDDNEYESLGVYDEFDEFNNDDEIRILTKDQTEYRFERLDSSEDIWYLIYIEDPNENRITLEYETSEVDNNLRRIDYVEAPSEKKLFFHYSGNTDYISSITDPINREIFFDVDVNNDERLEIFTDAKGNETTYRYIENDQNAPLADQKKRFLLDEIKLPRGNKITAEYDADDAKLENYQIDDQPPVSIYLDFDFFNNQQLATVTTPVDNNSDFNEDYEFNIKGLVTNYTSDTDELEIDYPSSGVNVMLPTETNLNGVRVDYEYDNNGNVTEINKENGDVIEEFDYDSDNNLIRYEDANDNETFFEYDSDENLLEIEDDLGNTITFVYDSHGQLINKTNQEGVATVYYYEDDGAVSDILMQENLNTHFEYDGINRLILKSRNGLTSTYGYDLNDNMTSFVNTGTFPTSYDYDANDNLSTITNANNTIISFTYDDKDRVTHEQFGSLVKQYEYTDEGYLERYTKPSGAEIIYEYDSDGRLTETGTITDFDYNNDNLIESVANTDSRYNFQYDNLNRLTEVEDEFNDNSIVEYEYDPVGNITKIIYPDISNNFEVRYFYDTKNRLERIRVVKNNASWDLVHYYYRDDDLLSSIEYSNNVEATLTYDTAGRKTGIEYKRPLSSGGDEVIFSETFTLNEQNNVLSDYRFYRSEETSSSVANPIPQSYSYDNNNHITSFSGNSMEVDDDGNTVQKTYDYFDPGAPGGTISYEYDIDDRLTNVIADHSNYGYPVSYIYDPYGNRIQKDQYNTTKNYIWDIVNNNVLVEYDPNNTTNPYFYVYGATGLEAFVSPQGSDESAVFFLGDLRGSVIALTGENGEIYNGFNKYDDFGNYISGAFGTPLENFKYLGKYGITLEHLSLSHYYIKARHYDAQLGRFLTEDPIWSTNLYPYADNNPVSNIDATGRDWESYQAWSNYFSNSLKEGYRQGILLEGYDPTNLNLFSGGLGYTAGASSHAIAFLGTGGGSSVLSGTAKARNLGVAGEKAVGVISSKIRIPSLTGSANYRIPDILTSSTLTEVKNTSYLSLTNQIKDFYIYSQSTNRSFVIFTRTGTQFSKPLQELINNGSIIRKIIPGL